MKLRFLILGLFLSLALNLNIHSGWLPSLPTVKTEVDADKAAQIFDAVIENRILQFENACTKFFEKHRQDLRWTVNEMRLGPVYAVGTTFMIASINMYWQALNDYLNITETDPEKLKALRKKVFGKIKAGLVFSALGMVTAYKSHQLAALLLGYKPEVVAPAPC